MISDLCKCGKPRAKSHRYCLACKAASMRTSRQKHPLSPMERMKMNARAYAHVYLKRGKLTKTPCESCNSEDSQMHHDDYSKPLQVQWLCRSCHMRTHREKLTP